MDISECFQNREKNLKNNDTEPVSAYTCIRMTIGTVMNGPCFYSIYSYSCLFLVMRINGLTSAVETQGSKTVIYGTDLIPDLQRIYP